MMKLDPLRNLRGRLKRAEEMDAWAAVAILLREEVDDYETLIVRRAAIPSDPWSGDMAFPGGKKKPGDVSLRDTVAREVQEETGIDLASLTCLGALPVLFSSIEPERSVLPIVYLYEGRPQIRLNPELVSYRWVHLRELEASRTVAAVKNYEGPVFKLGDDIVWGLTYRMLEKMLELMKA